MAGCGASHDALNTTFHNVSHADFRYSNEGLIDQETNLEMNLSLSGMFLWIGKCFDWVNLDKKFCDELLAVAAWYISHLMGIIIGKF